MTSSVPPDSQFASARPFTHDVPQQRIVFGPGGLEKLGSELERLGFERVLVVASAGDAARADTVAAAIGERSAGMSATGAMHTPRPITEAALARGKALGIDGVVSIGGGSATGLGKALAYHAGYPLVAIPTTLAGSECTDILGETDDGAKQTVRHRSILPRTVIYDPEYLATLPPAMAVASGLNAIAHGVEALYAPDRTPVTGVMAREGIARLVAVLPDWAHGAAGPSTHAAALTGAWLCGSVLNATRMGLHHRLCHIVGGRYNTPHAETHAAILPHVIAFYADELDAELGSPGSAAALAETVSNLARPFAPSLARFGVTAEAIEPIVSDLLENPYSSPRPLSEASLRSLVETLVAERP